MGASLVLEYVALGLAYDFQPLRNFAIVGQLGGLANQGVTVGIVALASLGLFLAANQKAVGKVALGTQLWQARRRVAIHLACLAGQVGVSHAWFQPGAPATVSPGVAALWLVLAVLTGVTAVAIAYVPTTGLQLRRVGLAIIGAVGLAVLTMTVAGSSGALWAPLQAATLRVVIALGAWFYPELHGDASTAIVGTPTFVVSVEPMCSGVEGMALMALLLPTFIWLNRRSFRLPRAYWLVPVGVAATWIVNAVRIFLLVVLGSEVSPELATGAFHSRAGWLLFSAMTISLAAYSIRSPFWSKRAAVASPSRESDGADLHNPVAPYVAPLVALIGMAMLTGTFALGVDELYGLRGVAVLCVAWFFRSTYRELVRGFDPILAVGAGVAAFAAWWLLTEPISLPSWTTLSGREEPLRVRAEAADLASTASVSWIVVRAVVSSTAIPLAEELAFRGYLLRRLVHREFDTVGWDRGSVVAVVVSSLVFGVMHDSWLAGFASGLIFAWVQRKTGSHSNAIVAHAVANAAVAVWVVAGGAWHQWL